MESNRMTEHSQFNPVASAAYKRREQALLYKLNSQLIERRLLNPGQRVLVAVSGGQDSVCLLAMLRQLHCSWHWRLAIVYCDHNWHSGSRLQAAHVSQLATSMSVSYYQTASAQPIHSESVARGWRYQSLQRIATRHRYTAIVTGHSASDRVETLIHHLFRGTGSNGLQSLSWKRRLSAVLTASRRSGKQMERLESREASYREAATRMQSGHRGARLQLIRPLLSMTRTELSYLIHQWQLCIWTDLTNRSLEMRRNRIRYQLLPYVRHYFNPQVDRALASWAEIVHAESVYLEALAACIRAEVADHHGRQHPIT